MSYDVLVILTYNSCCEVRNLFPKIKKLQCISLSKITPAVATLTFHKSISRMKSGVDHHLLSVTIKRPFQY